MRPLKNSIRRDPAPSRFKYRMQRLMLTPGIRLGLRIGIPFALTIAAASAYLAEPQRREALGLYVSNLRASIEERPEFMVQLMAIDGARPELARDIRASVPMDFPVSSFDLDLEDIRARISALDPVKSASVRIRPGGILQVDVAARAPAVVWRTREAISLLDETGAHIRDIPSRSDFPDLPLIAGAGADRALDEAMALTAAAGPLRQRVRGLVRVGERRWDLVLDRDQRIMLPAETPVRALERVIALSEAQDMLERDVLVVDMRLPERPTLRMSQGAVEEWWRIRAINTSGH